MDNDIIVAISTPPGKGGVGIIRLSGKDLSVYFNTLLKEEPKPRYAQFSGFLNRSGEVMDKGLVLYFPAPHSFTGEHVLELHAHGGPIILDMLLERCVELGARLAKPGEFSERAFLNDKIDLAQAEAIADLIDASSRQAAQGAMKSLQGVFSQQVHTLVESVIQLRCYVEAAIDFPEEEVDFLSDDRVSSGLGGLINQLDEIFSRTQQGSLLREGIHVVLAGKPNAGKSSLLNALTGKDSAIVTHIPGTTRDVLREYIHIDGLPLHIIDTAGLRESPDAVEKEGIRRAWQEIKQADCILYVIDASEPFDLQNIWPQELACGTDFGVDAEKILFVLNKTDICEIPAITSSQNQVVTISAKTGVGIDDLKNQLKARVGFTGTGEGLFSARRRHLDALDTAKRYLLQGRQQLLENCAGELLAEDLRQVQKALASITGEFTADDLLGKIFSSFCIGK